MGWLLVFLKTTPKHQLSELVNYKIIFPQVLGMFADCPIVTFWSLGSLVLHTLLRSWIHDETLYLRLAQQHIFLAHRIRVCYIFLKRTWILWVLMVLCVCVFPPKLEVNLNKKKKSHQSPNPTVVRLRTPSETNSSSSLKINHLLQKRKFHLPNIDVQGGTFRCQLLGRIINIFLQYTRCI